MNPYLDKAARRLLQKMNANPNLILEHDTDNGLWFLDGKTASRKAGEQLVGLCAVSSRNDPQRPFLKRYRPNQEGVKMLLNPGYVPLIIQARRTKP